MVVSVRERRQDGWGFRCRRWWKEIRKKNEVLGQAVALFVLISVWQWRMDHPKVNSPVSRISGVAELYISRYHRIVKIFGVFQRTCSVTFCVNLETTSEQTT